MKLLQKLVPAMGLAIFIFILAGDRILPQPFSTMSRDTRENINQFFLGLVPEDINNPYQNTKSDRIIEEVEKKKRGSN